jgi:prolipoprotein diacylglyceryltransferase
MSEAYTSIENFLSMSFLGVTMLENIIIISVILIFLGIILIITSKTQKGEKSK